MQFNFEARESDSPLVESVWQTTSENDGAFISSAQVNFSLVVSHYEGKTAITLRGPETKATLADCPAGAEFMGIVFKPGTFMPHLPARLLMNRQDVNLPEATGQAFWLQGATWQVPNFENVDTFVARLEREGLLTHEPVVDAVLQGQTPDLSLRTLQYRFVHATGLTHSLMRQIQRAQQAVELLLQGQSILDTVYDTGYFDQAHLTRSLKRFMGQTPAQIASPEAAFLYNTALRA